VIKFFLLHPCYVTKPFVGENIMMKHRIVLFEIFVMFVFGSVTVFSQDAKLGRRPPEPPMAGIQWAKGQAKAQAQTSRSPNLTYHGGPVMQDVVVRPIFWGPSWGNKTFFGDKMTGLASFYSGIGDSAYAGTCNEYSAGATQVSSTIKYATPVVDLSLGPNNGNQTGNILAEVCKVIKDPVSNGYYPVYVDTPRKGSYCAYHSSGSCDGGKTTIQFAFFYSLDSDWGCDPEDTSGLHSEGLAALANMSGHELSEARTDPRLNAWYDVWGYENADKCSWTFGNPLLTFSNGSEWKIQGNWSNAAYDNKSGYDGKGCIDGGAK
jgi:hypothetical protein